MTALDPPLVYLDNHATTRVDPRVVEAMLPWFDQDYGNPGSLGPAGDRAREGVDRAAATIADAIGAAPDELVFTSGATESNNLALRGVAERPRRRGDHLVSVQTEHASVLGPLARLERAGRRVTLLAVQPHGAPSAGRLDPQRVADALTDQTCLVSVMLANNEVGVIQPLEEVARLCRERGVLLHTDATQAVGKLPVDVRRMGVDLMSFSAHKLYGPKGIGCLYVRGRDGGVRLDPQVVGGGQQRGRRSGTLNVPGVVGLARALELCVAELPTEAPRLAALRRRLLEGLAAAAPPVELLGPALDLRDPSGAPLRLPGNLCVGLAGLDGQAVLAAAPGLAASTGAACSSTDPAPSHVLRALGLTDDQARASLRFGLGRFTTPEEVDWAVERVARSAASIRRQFL